MVKGKLYREYIPEYEYIPSIRGPDKTNNESKLGGSKPNGNWEEMKDYRQKFSKGEKRKKILTKENIKYFTLLRTQNFRKRVITTGEMLQWKIY